MRKSVQAFILGSALVGCSGSSASNTSSALTHCDKSQRNGSYLVHSVEHQGGTCGPGTDFLVQIPAPAPKPGDPSRCQVTNEVWSEGDCKLSSTVECAQEYGGSSRSVIVTTQQKADGSLLTGIQTFSDKSYSCALCPADYCTSTYDVTLTRQ